MEKKFNEFLSALNDIRTEVVDCIETLVKELGVNNKVVMPEDIDEYVYPEISYMGGNHPEYASNVFERIDSITLENESDIIIKFSNGCTQDLCENNLDDVLFVMQILLTIKKSFSC